jgi:hypothetical protein
MKKMDLDKVISANEERNSETAKPESDTGLEDFGSLSRSQCYKTFFVRNLQIFVIS